MERIEKNTQISKSLLELSDAIEQLAFSIAQQKSENAEYSAKEFEILSKRFKEVENKISNQDEKNIIYEKFKKGAIIQWLSSKGISIGKNIDNLKVDEKLYTVADFLSDHYFQLEEFYQTLKRHQVLKRNFLSKNQNSAINYIKKWCTLLHENKLIDAFYCFDDGRINIDISEIYKATHFINGYWLEIFLRKEIAKFIMQNIHKIQSFDILAQVELVKPDYSSSEFDLLLMVNNKYFWFECKSGEIGIYYQRFAEHRKILNLSQNQSFIVVPKMQMNQPKIAMKRSGMRMLYATNLEHQLANILLPSK